MRTQFEPADFKAGGQMVVRQNANMGNVDYLCSVAYKVGWRSTLGGNKHNLISLEDGMVDEFDSLDDLCGSLNKDQIGFRPMTVKEIVTVAEYQGNRF